MIERTREAVTDGSGQYRIIDLRPGIYTVTFTLGGFATVIREGVDLPTTFTANIDINMRVGALEESITVSLSAPDVGGTAGMQQTYMAVHGSDRRDNSIQVDGMIVNGIEGDGAIQNYFNQGMFEEMSYQIHVGARGDGSPRAQSGRTHLRLQSRPRRPDHEGQDLVLRDLPSMGRGPDGGRNRSTTPIRRIARSLLTSRGPRSTTTSSRAERRASPS